MIKINSKLDKTNDEEDSGFDYEVRPQKRNWFYRCLHADSFKKCIICLLLFLLVACGVVIGIQQYLYQTLKHAHYDIVVQEELRLKHEATYPDTLESLCSTTEWRSDLFLNCTNVKQLPGWPNISVNPQGAMNIRNSMLSCVRWAIDGGMGLILPRIAARYDKDIINFDHWEDYDFLFDMDMLRATLMQECPQLRLYDTYYQVEEQHNSTGLGFTHYEVGTFKRHIDDIVRDRNHTSNKTLVVWENEPLFGWNFFKENKRIHRSLYRAVNFRKDLLVIASEVVSLLPPRFVAIHLRNELDTIAYNYTSQVTPLLDMMKNNFTDIDTIYVAVGTPKIEEKFRADMKTHGYNVISKLSLLNSQKKTDLLDRVNKLPFDQRGVIDFQVLLRAEYFFGVGISSFAYGVAYERGNGDLEDCNCHLHGIILGEFKCCY